MSTKQYEFLKSVVTRSELHRKVLGDYAGAYSLGITRPDMQKEKYAIALNVEGSDTTRFPSEVEFDGRKIEVIVKGGFVAPWPLNEEAALKS